jgi:hypothetical protein
VFETIMPLPESADVRIRFNAVRLLAIPIPQTGPLRETLRRVLGDADILARLRSTAKAVITPVDDSEFS